MQITRDDRMRMERAHVLAWPALRCARIDGWLWRSSGGGSQRANSVSTIDFNGADAAAAITEVESRYRALGATARFQTFDETSPSALPDILQSRGYRQADTTITMFKPVRRGNQVPGYRAPRFQSPRFQSLDFHAPDRAAPDFAVREIEASDRPWPAWRHLLMAEITENRRGTNAVIIDKIPAPRRFFACRYGSRLVSTALCVIGWNCAVIECVATRSECRRQGAARAALTALQHWAVQQDVDWIGLQVAASNAPAIRLYESLGFSPGATNHFWIGPSGPG